ncbi:MAG: PIN domain-containing protein [Terriglobales bacterium]
MASFLDTNVLLYSISRDPAEAGKRERALALLDRADGALSLQVLQEFYTQATRPSRRDAVDHAIALDLIQGWRRFPVQDINLAVLDLALRIRAEHRLSYWDCAIVAAARMLGCRELLSEDLTHGQRLAGVQIVNPLL